MTFRLFWPEVRFFPRINPGAVLPVDMAECGAQEERVVRAVLNVRLRARPGPGTGNRICHILPRNFAVQVIAHVPPGDRWIQFLAPRQNLDKHA